MRLGREVNKMPKKEETLTKNQSLPEDQKRLNDESIGASQKINETRYFQQVTILVIYYFVTLLFSFWFLLDVWSRNFVIFRAMGMKAEVLADDLLRTIGFTMVGGILGSTLYQIRVLFHYYAKKRYDPRWFGKYLTSPLEGAGMAIVVLALIRGGVALFGGSTGTDVTAVNNFAAIGTGALVGFGMRDVVGWLGHLVHTMFTIPSQEGTLDQRTRHGKDENKPTEEKKL
jgi:hypothetical protein